MAKATVSYHAFQGKDWAGIDVPVVVAPPVKSYEIDTAGTAHCPAAPENSVVRIHAGASVWVAIGPAVVTADAISPTADGSAGKRAFSMPAGVETHWIKKGDNVAIGVYS